MNNKGKNNKTCIKMQNDLSLMPPDATSWPIKIINNLTINIININNYIFFIFQML